jgi:hypothetical protein
VCERALEDANSLRGWEKEIAATDERGFGDVSGTLH